MLKKAYQIMAKDLRIEFRQKEMLSAMLIFALLVLLLFGLAFNSLENDIRPFYPGLIWVVFIFSALLGLNRAFLAEKGGDALLGLMLSPVDRMAIYLGKLGGNFLLVAVVEAIAVPVSVVLLNYRFHGSVSLLILIIFLGTLGFLALGTFLAALAMNTRMSDLLLPLLLFPLLIPVVIGAVEATTAVLSPPVHNLWFWLKLLLAYDAMFLVIPLLLFEYLLEV